MTDLFTYLTHINTQLKQSGSSIEYCIDLDHWEKFGVKTVDEFKRFNLICDISDTYKEIYGMRPRYLNLNEWSLDKLQEYNTELQISAKRQFDWMDEMYRQEMQEEDEHKNITSKILSTENSLKIPIL
jgi:hypothetical protein